MQAEGILRLAAKALANGGQMVQPTRVEWDLSGDCLMPVGRDISYRQPKKALGTRRDYAWGVEWRRTHTAEKPFQRSPLPSGLVVGLTIRCRKCDKCRNGRRRLWTRRANTETGESFRTWFGTLTLRPERQMHFLRVARQRLAKQGFDYDLEPYNVQFSELVNAMSPDITKYLKRVRRKSGAALRFLWVCEVHKSGDPHFHALIHETNSQQQVSYRILTDEWGEGFTKWKLVTTLDQASYLTKYLSKSTAARVRASVRYGNNGLTIGLNNLLDREKLDPPITVLGFPLGKPRAAEPDMVATEREDA